MLNLCILHESVQLYYTCGYIRLKNNKDSPVTISTIDYSRLTADPLQAYWNSSRKGSNNSWWYRSFFFRCIHSYIAIVIDNNNSSSRSCRSVCLPVLQGAECSVEHDRRFRVRGHVTPSNSFQTFNCMISSAAESLLEPPKPGYFRNTLGKPLLTVNTLCRGFPAYKERTVKFRIYSCILNLFMHFIK